MNTEAFQKYEAVIGLEVHARLSTKSKLFSSDANAYGSAPNENVGVITLAHPGTLPKTNKKAIEYAVMTGIACNCVINQKNYFARKHYFYPDLPKGFQSAEFVLEHGFLDFIVDRKDLKDKLTSLLNMLK